MFNYLHTNGILEKMVQAVAAGYMKIHAEVLSFPNGETE